MPIQVSIPVTNPQSCSSETKFEVRRVNGDRPYGEPGYYQVDSARDALLVCNLLNTSYLHPVWGAFRIRSEITEERLDTPVDGVAPEPPLSHVAQIMSVLGDATEGCLDSGFAQDIARHALHKAYKLSDEK
jgi:hypothetical protein